MAQKKRYPTFRTDGEFAIHVPDLSKAESFYRDVLGFKLVSRSRDQLVFDTGVVTLYVNKDDRITPFIPALEVADYAEAREFLKKNGCMILREFEGGKALYFSDPFGITIDIVQKKK